VGLIRGNFLLIVLKIANHKEQKKTEKAKQARQQQLLHRHTLTDHRKPNRKKKTLLENVKILK